MKIAITRARQTHMSELSARLSQIADCCAILHTLDSASICVAADCSADEAEALLASNLVEPAANGYRLKAAVAEASLKRLREHRPADEVDLHARAFQHYLEQMQRADAGPLRLVAENACLHHLDSLFIMVGATMDWQALLAHVQAVRAVTPEQPRHRQRLDMYEGYIAIRTQHYEQGEAILTTLLSQPIDDPDVRIKALKGLADGYLFRSNYAAALEFYNQLRDAAAAADDLSYQGLALLNMAALYNDLDQHQQALDHCEQSLLFFHAASDERRNAIALYHAGLYSMYLGRWERVQRYSEDAAALYERLNLPNSLAFVYWLQGFVAHIFGDEAASEAAYRRALPLAASPQHGQPILEADTWHYLGLVYHCRDDYATALYHYERALTLAIQLDRPHQIALVRYWRGKALWNQGLLEAAYSELHAAIEGVELLRGSIEPEDLKISLLGTTQQIYEAMVLLCLDLERPVEAFLYVERARSRAFLDALSRKAERMPDSLTQPVANLVEVQARLGPDDLLLEYFTTGVLPRGGHLLNTIPTSNSRMRKHLIHPPRVLIFAIAINRMELYSPPIDPNRLRPQLGDPYPGRHLLNGRLPRHLYDQLIAPAAALLANRRLIYLIPHGPLHHVPFGVLRAPDDEYLLRADGPALAQAPSATILVRSCLDHQARRDGISLALGCNDLAGERPLRFAEIEAHQVGTITGGSIWAGPELKAERLKAIGPGLLRLHIAGHAHFSPDDPLGSAIVLGDNDMLTARAIIDGFTLNADLVTLSACTSGVSRVVPGDELLGLQRALLYAGAATVVCTRWEANDLVALLVMDAFYRAVAAGHSYAAALRDALVSVRRLSATQIQEHLARLSSSSELLAAQISQQLDTDDEAPFADPLLWAPFMLIGRP